MSRSKFGGNMIFILAFVFSGIVCLIGQILMDAAKLKPGVVTSLFVSIGAFLDIFNIYDYFIKIFGAGAMVVIPSFGHSLIHGALLETQKNGIIGLFSGMFSMTATGITATIIFSFIFSVIFKPKN